MAESGTIYLIGVIVAFVLFAVVLAWSAATSPGPQQSDESD